MHTYTEITQALADTLATVEKFILSNSMESLCTKPTEKWSIAEELDHLTKSNDGSVLAFSQPTANLRPTQHSPRSYDELVREYREKYAIKGVQMPTPLITSGLRARHTVNETFAFFEKASQAMQKSLAPWTDNKLDGVTVWKHPLLGPVTAREMIFFTLFHNRHHLASMQQKLAVL